VGSWSKTFCSSFEGCGAFICSQIIKKDKYFSCKGLFLLQLLEKTLLYSSFERFAFVVAVKI
jgi:hypothetical protein